MCGGVHSPYEEALLIIINMHIRPSGTFGYLFWMLRPESELDTKKVVED
jgi:hypothetical protein